MALRRLSNPAPPAALAAALLLAACMAPLAAAQQQGGDLGATAPDAALAADPFADVAPSSNGSQPSATENGGKFGIAPGVGTPGGPQRLKYTGIATVAYAEQPISPFDAAKLGCSLGFVSPTFQSNYVGVSPDLFQQGFACGRCIKQQCDDVSCAQPATVALPALVADVCGSCTKADLSISTPLFKNLTGRDPGANPSIVMSWDVVPCAPYTNGTIKMLVKEGGSAYYQAFGFSNSVQPIAAVQVNGTRLVHESSNWWSYNPGQPINPAAPLDIALAAANREVLRAKVPTLRSADLGVQFRAR